jgi:hypothetical protein
MISATSLPSARLSATRGSPERPRCPNKFDTISALENWVEHGIAPEAIVATKYTNGMIGQQSVLRTCAAAACLQLRARGPGHKTTDLQNHYPEARCELQSTGAGVEPEGRAVTEQALAIIRARNKAFRWPKGVSGNPDGQSRFYHESRRLAREAGPAMMKVLIELALSPEADERVRSVCAVAVLDRAGVRPIDKPEEEKPGQGPAFDPEKYTREELAVIKLALQLMISGSRDASKAAKRTSDGRLTGTSPAS